MEKTQQQQPRRRSQLLFSLAVSLLLASAALFFPSPSSFTEPVDLSSLTFPPTLDNAHLPLFVEEQLRRPPPGAPPPPPGSTPKLAYVISGSGGDGESLKRVLRALYHPFNSYVLHLDLEAPAAERAALAAAVRADAVYARFRNVHVVVKANLVTYRGPSMVANTLHAAAILLRLATDWDWFINLSASDYPLVTQDDLLYVLSSYPRHLNFIDHTSNLGWKVYHRALPVIVDPGLHSSRKSEVHFVSERRNLPSAFKLFTGSAWMMLSREFMEFCVWGWDNLPRAALMYYANFVSSPEGYFHTVICNAEEFRNTTVNHDLHFISWDNPPKQHPHSLELADFPAMLASNAPFARKFAENASVLDRIDVELLDRRPEGFAYGSWWSDGGADGLRLHPPSPAASELSPGAGAARLKTLIDGLISSPRFHESHCL
ncbi:beta-glucuronosyltransferase GlcAT14A-like [Wolffia australiana]